MKTNYFIPLLGALTVIALTETTAQETTTESEETITQIVETTVPAAATDSQLKEALIDPDGFQSTAAPSSPVGSSSPVTGNSTPTETATTAPSVPDSERSSPSPSVVRPLPPEKVAERKTRMRKAIDHFSSLRQRKFQDPDSRLNREILEKMELMRRKRLAARERKATPPVSTSQNN